MLTASLKGAGSPLRRKGMVFKRGSIYWYQFQHEGKRYRISTKQTNRAAALRVEAERRTNLRDDRPVQPPMPFRETFDAFLEWCSSHVRPKTYKRYRVSGKRLESFFGVQLLQSFGHGNVTKFQSVRIRECSGARTNL